MSKNSCGCAVPKESFGGIRGCSFMVCICNHSIEASYKDAEYKCLIGVRIMFRACFRRASFSVLALTLVYFASYFYMLQTFEFNTSKTRIRFPYYRLSGDTVKAFYSPALWVDKKVRPAYWFKPE